MNNSWHELVLDADNPIALSINLKSFTTISNSSEDVISFDISIPYELNETVFQFVMDGNSSAGKELLCENIESIIDNGVLCFTGITSITADSSNAKSRPNLVLGFRSGLGAFCEMLPEKLRELDCTTVVDWTARGIRQALENDDPYDGTNPVYASLKWRGGLDDFDFPSFGAKDRIPSLYHTTDIHDRAILDKIFEHTNTCLISEFFDTEYYRRMLTALDCAENNFEATLVDLEIQNPSTIIRGSFGQVAYDDFFDNNYADIVSQSKGVLLEGDFSSSLQFSDTIDVRDDNPTVRLCFEVKFEATSIHDDGEIELIVFDQANNSPVFQRKTKQQGIIGENCLEIEYEASLDAQIIVRLLGDTGSASPLAIAPNSISYKIRAKSTIPLGCFGLGQSLPDKDVKNWLEEETKKYNIVWCYDAATGCMYAEPKWGTTLPTGEVIRGWYGSINQAIDVTEYLVCEEESTRYGISDYKRTLRFLMNNDTDDDNIEELTGGCDYELCTRNQVGISEDGLDCYGATHMDELPENFVPTDGTPPVVPYITSEGEDNEYCGFGLRTLYKCGQTEGDYIGFLEFNSDTVPYLSLGTPLETYPYATFFDAQKNINLGWCDRDGVKGRTSLHYEKDIELYRCGRDREVILRLPKTMLTDIKTLTRTPIRINCKQRGNNVYILESIGEVVLECSDIAVVSAKIIQIS